MQGQSIEVAALGAALTIVAAVAGCSSHSPASAGEGGDGGTQGTSGSDLTGTWDLTATSPGSAPSTGTLTISTNSLTIAIGSDTLSYASAEQADGAATLTTTWTAPETNGPSEITTQRTPLAFDLGIIPLSLGGLWQFTGVEDPTQSCRAAASSETLSATCTGNVQWPDFLGSGLEGSATYSAVRMTAMDSQFGQLGGTWQVAQDQDTGGCTVTFQGSTFSATCMDADVLDGMVQLTFNGTSMASGSTSNGLELSAQKQ
jgi:hypothetical protein